VPIGKFLEKPQANCMYPVLCDHAQQVGNILVLW